MKELVTTGCYIYTVAWWGKTDTVKELVAAGCDINLACKDGWTPIFASARYGKTDAVKELVATGCDINLTNESGDTPIQVAEQYGHASVATLIRGKQLWNTARDGNTSRVVAL